jgi:hypothetical protein
MQGKEAGIKDFAKLILHLILVAVVLAVWIITASAIDRIVLAAFPLPPVEKICFRIVEVLLHLSTLRVVYHTLFPRR